MPQGNDESFTSWWFLEEADIYEDPKFGQKRVNHTKICCPQRRLHDLTKAIKYAIICG